MSRVSLSTAFKMIFKTAKQGCRFRKVIWKVSISIICVKCKMIHSRQDDMIGKEGDKLNSISLSENNSL